MKHFALILFTALTASAQMQTIGGAGGTGAPNPYTYTAGASTSSAVNITSLNATNDRSLIAQCWTSSGPVTITSWSTSGGPPLTTATMNYTSTSGVTCKVNNTGGAGATGATGAIGPTGPPPTVSVGTTTTSNPGTSANVVRSGTDAEPIFTFTIPRGDVGATGAKGDKGDTGNTGSQGIQGIQGIQGPAGPVGSAVGADFTGATTGTLTHNLATKDVTINCRDASDVAVEPLPPVFSLNSVALAWSPAFTGRCWATTGGGGSGGGGSMTYPGAGVANSTGAAWGTSYAVGTSANNLVQLNGSAQLPALSGVNLTGVAAATAAALATARTIFGVSFDGTGNIGSRSGNTSELASVSGAKTTGKQLQFDASGNIAASSTDIGAGSGGSAQTLVDIPFSGGTTATVTAASHGLGTTPAFAGCRRTSDGVWPAGAAYSTNNSGDVTIVPAAGAAFTGHCYIAGGFGGVVNTGAGLTGTGSVGSPLRIDPNGGAASQALYSAALTSWGTISAAACVEKSITATGAVAGETVAAGWPGTLPANLTGIMFTAADLLVVRLCNITGSGIAVGDGLTFSGRIIRGF